MNDFKTFKTERLVLKPMQIEDAAFLLELLNTPKWIKHIGDRNVHTIKEAEEYIKIKMFPQLKELGYGNYLIVRKADNSKIGTCGLYNREGIEGIDIGFAFLPQFEKHGYGFEAAQKIVDVGFNEFNISQISAITTKENIDSQKLIEKLGLKFEKIINIPNDPEDLRYYSLQR
ncbi:GNAT family N-acetyltransferase [Lutibacter sp. TH_r2]|uniref:GNAT family N-acetyltransferase n=1 Tax=Lutibacter sp. TH_r2 TaxID=3082083 RepID=UPI002953BD36|nr:GNAT family N-acetyltransferase [Lutibacter sp. TH_r2]MDV7187369.1 GNAT family N-acetyltransferase [Lutibacter sp. TH_r2]